MVVHHQERTCQYKFPSKSIETEKPEFIVKVNKLRWFEYVKQSELYTGQILDLKVEGNRSCDCPKTYWLDVIKDELR